MKTRQTNDVVKLHCLACGCFTRLYTETLIHHDTEGQIQVWRGRCWDCEAHIVYCLHQASVLFVQTFETDTEWIVDESIAIEIGGERVYLPDPPDPLDEIPF